MLRVYKREFKEAMDFVKCAVGKDSFRPVLTGIHLKLKDSRLMVTSVDGFRMMQTSIEIIESDSDNFECIVDYNMPVKATKKEIDGLDIEIEGKTLSVKSFCTNQIISYPIIDGEYINTDSLWPEDEPEYEICLNPKYVMEMARAYKDEKVINFKFYGNLRPVVVVPETKYPKPEKALLLPI